MKLLDTRLTSGDVVSVGEVEATETEQPNGGGLRIIAVHSGEETTEYVALRFTASESGELDLPDSAEVLSVEDGTGFANPSVWVLVPKSDYSQ